jgi:hypothetical protein
MRKKWNDPTLYAGLETLNKEISKWQNKPKSKLEITDYLFLAGPRGFEPRFSGCLPRFAFVRRLAHPFS